MRDQRRLLVLRMARELAVAVYRLTANFPPAERFGLTDQMRRSVVSVGSNIAEGAGRNGDRDFLRFVYMAYASGSELAFQLGVASDLGFGLEDERRSVAEATDHLQRKLNRLAGTLAPRRADRAVKEAERRP